MQGWAPLQMSHSDILAGTVKGSIILLLNIEHSASCSVSLTHERDLTRLRRVFQFPFQDTA